MKRVLALCLIAGACSGAAAASTAPVALRQAALDYAASADRALDGTRFEGSTPADLADAIVGVCLDDRPLDASLAAAAMDAPAGPAGDDQILSEVLTEGVREACPDRSGSADVAAAYLAAVRDAVASADPGAVVDEAAIGAAGPVACDLLDRGQGAQAALLGVVAALFDVEAGSIADLETALTRQQGVIAGATLGAAATYLCSDHATEVGRYLQGL